ncbi:hypothetical protein GWI33_007087 [Rhynchophorus ferrugineus]|uniref:Uncharacterized protein n=1 Tax=Rhynchophorus ferrugineus TaxID=354439 RepID=A0A834IKR0_RHYFE|nr:hypothetical protein GWI33_007087 [Rhynchophorus ferrugineus]
MCKKIFKTLIVFIFPTYVTPLKHYYFRINVCQIHVRLINDRVFLITRWHQPKKQTKQPSINQTNLVPPPRNTNTTYSLLSSVRYLREAFDIFRIPTQTHSQHRSSVGRCRGCDASDRPEASPFPSFLSRPVPNARAATSPPRDEHVRDSPREYLRAHGGALLFISR